MGRLSQQKERETGGRLTKSIPERQIPLEEPRKKGFIRGAPENIRALRRGEISVKDVAREVPGVVRRGVIKAAETFVPAITNFFRTTGGILGEGLAYAVDPEVRKELQGESQRQLEVQQTKVLEEIKAKKLKGEDTTRLSSALQDTIKQSEALDILPTISETSQADLAKDVIAAGIETAVYRSVPDVMKLRLGPRAGVGAIEGLGFAISEGLANDESAEEIVKNAMALGPIGAAVTVIAPHLLPLLKAEIGKAPREIKELFKGLQAEVKTKGRLAPGEREIPVKDITPEEVPVAIKKPGEVIEEVTPVIEKERITKVDPDIIPVKTEGELKVSRLEARTKEVLDEVPANKAEEAGLTTFNQMNKREQIRQASEFVEKAEFDEVVAILTGSKPAPKGLLHNSIALAAEQKAIAAADKNLAIKLASLRSTRAGQEISILTEADPSNPISKIHEIIKARTESATRKLKAGKTLKSEASKNIKEASETLSKSQLKISDAESLLKSIVC